MKADRSDAAGSSLEGGVVRYRVAGPVAEITLNRPEVLNAINGAVHRGILAALDRAAGDDTVRVVVLRGSGRAFSAGGDLKAVAAGEDVGHPLVLGQAIWNLAKPVIAAVHGYCLGQACELAGVCDLTVATTSAWESLSLSADEVSFASIFTSRTALERSSGSTWESKEKSSIATQAPSFSH